MLFSSVLRAILHQGSDLTPRQGSFVDSYACHGALKSMMVSITDLQNIWLTSLAELCQRRRWPQFAVEKKLVAKIAFVHSRQVAPLQPVLGIHCGLYRLVSFDVQLVLILR